MHLARYDELRPYVTADGSTIREWAGPGYSPARNQSLAEATLPPGSATIAHFHPRAEELYLFRSGCGRLRIGDDTQDVAAGDCAVIPPGVIHKLWNTHPSEDLVLVCACSPAYSHDDTVLVEGEGAGTAPPPSA